MSWSNLDIISQVDSVPYPEDLNHSTVDQCYKFYSHDNVCLGYVLPIVAAQLESETSIVTVDSPSRTIKILSKLCTLELRSEAFAKLLAKWRNNQTFNVLKGWRDELYTVYNPTRNPYMLIERSGACLFGVVTYGIHLVGYVPDSITGKPSHIWVPQRSLSKPTHPGMLDNTVAGGIGYPYSREETVIKECEEEAGLTADYVMANTISTGVVTYFFRKRAVTDHEDGVFQPEVEYLYEMKMDKNTIPRPADGEVEKFILMSIDDVKLNIAAGKFKYNTALVTLEFLIRHGFITAKDDDDYIELIARMHRKLDYPLM